MTTEELKTKAFDRAEEIEDAFRVLAEQGLFNTGDEPKRVMDLLTASRKATVKEDWPEALDLATQAELLLDEVLRTRSRWWRATRLHQIPLFAYHAGVLTLLLLAPSIVNDRANLLGWKPLGVPSSAAVAGGVGSVLRGLWWLWMKVSQREYRTHFLLAHLATPLIGIVLGIVAYLLVRSGVQLAGEGPIADGQMTEPVILVALFAGYNWEWALEKLEKRFA